MTQYLVYDVFTDRAFGGNPLAIIPDASALPETALQSIAREFNFSETSFVYPPQDPSHTARVRIFTPTQEVPFAGHPTIGTAIALAAAGHGPDMVLELGIGPIRCHATATTARFTTNEPLRSFATPDTALVARALGVAAHTIATDLHPPTQVSLGLPFVITALTDRAALAACTTDLAAFREGQDRYPTDLDFAIFAYLRDGDTVHARMFAPLDNIPEDPATGSACATLGAFLHHLTGTAQNFTVSQGVDMGRPALIGVSTEAKDPVPVTITGQAVPMMEGRLLSEGWSPRA